MAQSHLSPSLSLLSSVFSFLISLLIKIVRKEFPWLFWCFLRLFQGFCGFGWDSKSLVIVKLSLLKPKKAKENQKRPDVHKIALSVKLQFPPPWKSVNFEYFLLICTFFLILGPFRGGGG